MKPITKSTEEKIDELITKRTTGIAEKLDEISSKMSMREKESKVEDIISNMRNKIPERITKPSLDRTGKSQERSIINDELKNIEKVKEKIIEHEHDHNEDVYCPTCSKGHVHKIDGNGLTMKCTGKDCGEEFVIVPKSADYKCKTCGLPVKKPTEKGKDIESCPFCGGNEAKLFDFSKLMKKQKET